MNSTATVSGMSATTTVASNILVAETNEESAYNASLSQSRVGKLEPVSTTNGINYFYTANDNVNANGSAKTNTYVAYNENADPAVALAAAGKENYDKAFQTNYGVTEAITESNIATKGVFGYIDYVFYLKATNASDAAKELRMTKCNLLDNNGALTANDKAWRVAVFVQDAEEYTELATPIAAGDLKSILSVSGAAYFENKAVSGTNTTAAPTNLGTGVVVKSVAKGATVYQKLTVRLWLEGADTKCNNDTYVTLTNAHTLDLAFTIDEEDAAVTSISSVTA